MYFLTVHCLETSQVLFLNQWERLCIAEIDKGVTDFRRNLQQSFHKWIVHQITHVSISQK